MVLFRRDIEASSFFANFKHLETRRSLVEIGIRTYGQFKDANDGSNGGRRPFVSRLTISSPNSHFTQSQSFAINNKKILNEMSSTILDLIQFVLRIPYTPCSVGVLSQRCRVSSDSDRTSDTLI
jgi:hypothetical protein